jgi:hypothetical protein
VLLEPVFRQWVLEMIRGRFYANILRKKSATM